MYKISINQNEKSKCNYKKEKNPLLKIIFLLFTIMMIIITMILLIIISNNWNSAISTNNSSNWNPNQDNIWEEYYKNNCPPNKKYKLTDYKESLKNIILKSTNKKLKNFYLSDLLKNIDNVLQTNNMDIPNNFFAHLPINPAVDIKINNEDALNNDFLIKIPSYKEKIKQFTITININQLGNSYNLTTCNLKFNFNVENDVMSEKFNIFDLANKIAMPLQTISMVDATKGTKNEIALHVNQIIQEKFLEKVNEEKLLSDKVTKNDFDLDFNLIKNIDNYTPQKKITVVINANTDSEIITGQLNINFDVKGIWTIKSLAAIKSVLANDERITNELITVIDDTNVSKTNINNHISSLISKKINKFGQERWHQIFSEQDYIISNNASAGNYQQAKKIVVTIIGKNQLQGTIQLQIYIRCHNQSANEKVFKNSNFNVNNLNPITLYPNVLPTGVIYAITFKNDPNLLTSLLFKTAIKDLNDFSLVDNISLELNIEIKLDSDNYQINYQQAIEPNVIKKINDIVLVTDFEQNGEYQHLKNIGIIIKYNDNQEYKIIKMVDVNIKNNSLTFINFGSLVKITSWR